MKRTLLIFLALSFGLLFTAHGQQTETAAANPNFEKSGLFEFFWGKHYRQEWLKPITVPVFDPATFKGGVEALKLGGGHQTKSIRFKTNDSTQYNLRSIDKFPELVLPEALRGTWVNNILKDQISSAHPYAFMAIPKMADAIGVYHTSPEIYYLKKSTDLPGYEDFLNEFGDHLFMTEIRPDEDLSNYERFGNSKNIVGTDKLFEQLYEDNDNSVDELQLAKTRLFDMILGDWDRHWDQWRWAEYDKDDKGERYEAVPRDRDQAFVLMDGLLPSIIRAPWAVKELTHFDYEIKHIDDINFAGRHVDRNLLTRVTREEWVGLAKEIQENLTDEVIERSVQDLPEEIYAMSGEEITAKLKSRRDKIDQYAEAYYVFLSKFVRIVGSNKHELFKVSRIANDTVRVEVYKTKKEGDVENKIYDRTFYASETKELWLYGLDGIDKFEISGDVDESIKVRIVGGEGEDEFKDESNVKGWSHKTKIYDYPEDIDGVERSKETAIVTSKHRWVNEFNRDEFNFDYVGPRLSLEINPDDGLFLGGGIYVAKQGFRRDPARTHMLVGNVSTKTGGFNLKTENRFYSLIGHDVDLAIDGWGHSAKFAFNYFGEGNDTQNNRDLDYYRVSLSQVHLEAPFIKRFGRMFSVGMGPVFESANVQENPNTILSDQPENTRFETGNTDMLGAKIFADLAYMDHPVHPSKGIKWSGEVQYLNELGGNAVNFAKLSTDLSLYYTPNLPFRMTFAARFGVSENAGDFMFYQSNFLGGQTNLRGFRRTRFAGKGSAYQNTEVRLSLAQIKNVVLNGDFGIIGFVDHGKVWSDIVPNESTGFTRTYGPGLYLHFYEMLVASAHYGFTPNSSENYFTFDMGFLF